MISQRIAVNPDCDRTFISKINFHVSAENPAGNGKPIASKSILETLKDGFCNYWWRSVCKAWAATPARVSIKGELRDGQNISTTIEERTVHLAFIVFKDAQMDNFIGQGFYLNLVIAQPNSQKYQEPTIYLADDLLINSNTSPTYSLY